MINRKRLLSAVLALTLTVSGTSLTAFAVQKNISKSALPMDTAVAGIALNISNYGNTNSDAEVSKVLATATYTKKASVAATATKTSNAKNTTATTKNSNVLTVKGNTIVNVRAKASKSAAIVGKMYRGCKATIVKKDGKWYKIKSGTVTGWVYSSYVYTGDKAARVLEKVNPKTATVNVKKVNVRSKKSTSAKIVLQVKRGNKYRVLKKTSKWVKVQITPNVSGWISAEYVTIKNEACKASSATALRRDNKRIQKMEKERAEEAAAEAAAKSASGKKSSSSKSSSKTSSRSGGSSRTYSSKGAAIAAKAKQYAGRLRYRWGGSSLSSGADCSGFVMAIYSCYGIGMPHSAAAQASRCRSISRSQLQPGDLVFYGRGRISHVGIYIGGGMICHEANTRRGCRIDGISYCGSPVKYGTVLH